MRIHRGGLYLANLGSRHGAEPGKIRPVLVIQTNLLNNVHASTVVIPLTSKIQEGFQLMRIRVPANTLTGLAQESDALLDQIRAIDNRRFKKALGGITGHLLDHISENLRLLLDLHP